MPIPPDAADLAIVGGGAAGLATAIFAAEAAAGGSGRILVLDGARSLGAKILVAGGGRCNVTHDEIKPDDFNGPRNVVRNVLAAFDERAAVRWFASMGVELKREETGKLFPVTDSARTVLNALLRRCEALGVVIRTGTRVTRVARERDGFLVEHSGGAVRARRAVLATGGRSLPRSGSDGVGWEVARSLGHTVTPTFAALAPRVLDASRMFHVELAGVSHDVELSTFVAGKRVDRRTGSLLWTHFGISGPVVMDASRHWVIPHESGRPAQMRANLLPGQSFEAVERWLIESAASRARSSVLNAVATRLPERVAAAGLKFVGVEPGTACGQLSRDGRRALVHALTALPLPVVGHRGWNYAEVTAGGVPLAEVDFRTMESRIAPGLFLAGEILDCDGRIGGFNFQWAWATGFLAGRGAMRGS
jgi:predicted Rossmann fold flavoprotein